MTSLGKRSGRCNVLFPKISAPKRTKDMLENFT